MSLIDSIRQHLGQSEVNQISQQLGVDPSQAQSAISAAVPLMVGGMASHAQSGGADAIQQAIGAHEGATDNVSTLLQAGPPADQSASGGLLGRVLGNHTSTVQQGVQQSTGLGPDKTQRLLMMLAPIMLGVLAHKQFGGQSAREADPSQITNHLNEEARTAAKQSPHVGGLLGKMLNAVESPRR